VVYHPGVEVDRHADGSPAGGYRKGDARVLVWGQWQRTRVAARKVARRKLQEILDHGPDRIAELEARLAAARAALLG